MYEIELTVNPNQYPLDQVLKDLAEILEASLSLISSRVLDNGVFVGRYRVVPLKEEVE